MPFSQIIPPSSSWRKEEGSGWGTCVYLWQIHVDIWQNQYNIAKLKNKRKKKKTEKMVQRINQNINKSSCLKKKKKANTMRSLYLVV